MGDFSDTAPRHLGAVFFQRVEQLGERTFVKLQRKERFLGLHFFNPVHIMKLRYTSLQADTGCVEEHDERPGKELLL